MSRRRSEEGFIQMDIDQASRLQQALSEKRKAVAAELARLPGGANSQLYKDVFQLCRGFERAFTYTIEKTDYSGYIRRAFSEEGLAGAINKLPLEKRFRLDRVKDVVREADGYQPHLVSPELGLRRLVDESVTTVLDPVFMCVRRIHQILLDVAREAARKATLLVESTTLDEDRQPIRMPGFEAAVMAAATQSLEGWRAECLEVTRMLVEMETEYVTAAFFRHRTYERYRQQQTAQLLAGVDASAGGAHDNSDSDDEDSRGSADGSPAGGQQARRGPEASYGAPPPPAGPLSGGFTIPPSVESSTADLKTGYLEKRIGEKSTRQNLPESFKWQRRFFVLSDAKGSLFYFNKEEDVPKYKGLVDLSVCKVEDVDADGLPKANSARSKYDLDGGSGSVSLLIRISHKDPSRPCVKNHQSIILRAETGSEKYAWLARLKHASEALPGGPRPPIKSFTSEQLAAQREASVTASGDLGPRRDSSRALDPAGKPVRTPKTHEAPTGIGATLLFAEDSKLGPQPLMYSGQSPAERAQRLDEYLGQLAEDTAAYVRTVCNTIAITCPKAIVHCQVKRAQAHLLERLYAHINVMTPAAKELLLEEDPETHVRRARTKKAVDELSDGLAQLKVLLEDAHKDRGAASPRGGPAEALEVPREVAELVDFRRGVSDYSRAGATSNGGAAELQRRVSGSGAPGGPQANGALPPAGPSGAGQPPVARTSSGMRRNTATPPPRVSIPGPVPANLSSSPSPVPRRRPPPAPPGAETSPAR